MGRQKRKEYAFYAVLAGTFLLIAGAYGSGEKSVQQNAKEMGAVAEKAVAEPEYVPAVRLYAGIFTKLDGEEYAVIEKNKDILVAAANRGYFDESDVYSFLQGPKSWGEGRAWSGEWSNQYVRGNYFGNFGCGLQIYTVHFQVIPVRRGTCFCMQERSPVTHRRKRSVRSAGAI